MVAGQLRRCDVGEGDDAGNGEVDPAEQRNHCLPGRRNADEGSQDANGLHAAPASRPVDRQDAQPVERGDGEDLRPNRLPKRGNQPSHDCASARCSPAERRGGDNLQREGRPHVGVSRLDERGEGQAGKGREQAADGVGIDAHPRDVDAAGIGGAIVAADRQQRLEEGTAAQQKPNQRRADDEGERTGNAKMRTRKRAEPHRRRTDRRRQQPEIGAAQYEIGPQRGDNRLQPHHGDEPAVDRSNRQSEQEQQRRGEPPVAEMRRHQHRHHQHIDETHQRVAAEG